MLLSPACPRAASEVTLQRVALASCAVAAEPQ